MINDLFFFLEFIKKKKGIFFSLFLFIKFPSFGFLSVSFIRHFNFVEFVIPFVQRLFIILKRFFVPTLFSLN